MGCGGSKEDKSASAGGVDNDKPQPIKKIRTNFSDIHYDEPASARREANYAPSEQPDSRRPTEIAEEPASPPAAPNMKGADGMLSPGSPASPEIQQSQSWFERMRENKKGKPLADEEYQKVFGMTKEEFQESMKDKPVGPRQPALNAGNPVYMGLGADG